MDSVGGTLAGPRPPMRWRIVLVALVAVIGLALAAGIAAGVAWSGLGGVGGMAGRAPSASAAAWNAPVLALMGLPILLGGAALGLLVGWQSQRASGELREARERARCIDDLLDVWQWQTDAEHRLVLVCPPRRAPCADGSAAAPHALLWQHFQVADEAALRAQLARHAPLDDIEARRAGASGGARHYSLCGRARTDAAGAFAGYQGLLREAAPVTPQAQADAASLPAASPAPVDGNGSNGNSDNAAPTPDALEAEHESFSFTVSHDLRAPIRVVEGFTKIVKEDYGRLLDRVGNDHLDRVLGAAARMNNMIDALLALSKLSSQPLARQPVNLSQLAGYVADDLRRQWPEREVQIDIEPDMLVQGDPTLLRVVIENLLGNAWKYSAKAAHAQIAFRRRAGEADTFSVSDNGAGFDMRFADRLFGVFQRLHSANDFPGTGVGLASVRRIVRRHGGEIWGEAEVNRGARFHFTLPQVQRGLKANSFTAE
jgi:signal transduction histidine kinase